MQRLSLAGKAALILLSVGLAATLILCLIVVKAQIEHESVMNVTDTKLQALFIILAISPYAALILFLWHFNHTAKSLFAFLAGSVLITFAGVAALAESILINPDAQSQMQFLIVPAFQWIALILLVGICKYLKNLDRSASAGQYRE